VLDPDASDPRRLTLEKADDGSFSGVVDELEPGALYMFSPDGEGPFPDPASRFQPRGVHGPSAFVDPARFQWTDSEWRGLALEQAIVYELHVGTFTRAGTFAEASKRLPYLADLGVTVVELMPVADFPGRRNWGYDGVSLFAPSRAYGTPDDLRQFVDLAHRVGLAVFLDVVYNHFGPDGAYAVALSPRYFSTRHTSPWGAAVNVDGEDAAGVREFFIENALHWVHEYHIDGLRLDATHAIVDTSPRHFVAELTERVKSSQPARTRLVVGEDDRNLSVMITPVHRGGWGLDGVWSDDFHHQVRRLAAGDVDGYFADYSGALEDLATTIRSGWFYQGQYSTYRDAPRGTSPAGLPLERMFVCLQNHDQIGNRAFGDRLTASVSPEMYRALSALLLFVPETPLLFMGQEWAATTPFQYFTDHHAELGRLVTEGRRSEFARFEIFASPSMKERIPDPQADSTFEKSRLDWTEAEQPEHAEILSLYRHLIALRRTHPALRSGTPLEVGVEAETSSLFVRRGGDADTLLMVIHLPARDTRPGADVRLPGSHWEVVVSTEASARAMADGSIVRFAGPAAVILRPA